MRMRARLWGEKRNPKSIKAGMARRNRHESKAVNSLYNREVRRYHITIRALNMKGGTHRARNNPSTGNIFIRRAEKASNTGG